MIQSTKKGVFRLVRDETGNLSLELTVQDEGREPRTLKVDFPRRSKYAGVLNCIYHMRPTDIGTLFKKLYSEDRVQAMLFKKFPLAR